MTFNKSTTSIRKTYSGSIRLLKENPSVFLPFLLFGLIELSFLILIYLSPRQPFILLFGPPIKTFWGEMFLHYPLNFLLLPKLSSFSRMAFNVLFGSLFNAAVVVMLLDIFNKKKLKIGKAFGLSLKKYLYLFSIILLVTVLFYFSTKFINAAFARYFMRGHTKLLFIKSSIWMGPILFTVNFIAALFIQSIFVYVIPILMVEKLSLSKSIKKSFVLFRKLFIITLILVGVPMLLFLPVLILNYNTAYLINALFPEFIMIVAVLGAIISSLVIDPLVVVTTTFLYLNIKD